MSTPPPKKRDSNLELFRIISMLGIVAAHYVNNSGLMDADGPISANPMSSSSIFLLLFGAWGKSGINCFVMITGYFMCKSSITAKKFVKLVGEWLFYRYLIHAIFVVTSYESLSIKRIIEIVVPITQISTNFTSCFVLFFLFIPFLNILISHLSEKQHLSLLLLTGFTYIVLGTVHRVTMNYVSWFMVLYLIASYIRIYPKAWMQNNRICGPCFMLSIVLSATSVVVCTWLGLSSFFFVVDSNTVLAVMVGVFGFLFFRNLKIPYNKLINTIAASTFGVLCIHAHSDSMRQWLWKDLLDNVGHYGMPFYAIGAIVGVFSICVIIDIIRINLVEMPFFRWWDTHWESIKKMIKVITGKLLPGNDISE